MHRAWCGPSGDASSLDHSSKDERGLSAVRNQRDKRALGERSGIGCDRSAGGSIISPIDLGSTKEGALMWLSARATVVDLTETDSIGRSYM